MNFSEIKELIELINSSDLSYLEIQNKEDYIKMDKSLSRNYIYDAHDNIDNIKIKDLSLTDNEYRVKLENNLNDTTETTLTEDDTESNCDYIKSPIVGTFYESSSPESQPFVRVGQKINKGQVVCIIEAMKLMNEITCEYDCEVVDILSENGKMVEYGQSLFKIRRV